MIARSRFLKTTPVLKTNQILKTTHVTGDAHTWRRFSFSEPPLDDIIQIRRLHDDKTILRRRSDLPPTFPYKTAEWRPA